MRGKEHVFMYKKMLVTLDGSQFAEAVLPYVEEIARKNGATVELIHVVQPPDDGPYDTSLERIVTDFHPRLDQMVSRMTSSAQHYLDFLAEGLRARGINVQSSVLHGRPSNE